jgi:two-component system, NarL family, invasion response regulator UvrY
MNLPSPASQPNIRILIADDHALVREGIRKVLGFAGDVTVVGEAATAADVLSRVQFGDVDLLLLDLLMPGSNDVDLIERVVAVRPKLPILVLTMHADPHIARRALAAGALGYLTKDTSPELLIDAVHHVAAGRDYFDPSLSGALIRSLNGAHESPAQVSELSARERQVLVALVEGKSVIDIAAALGLAANTVSTYKARLMDKLGQASLSDLVRYAMRNGLVD